MKFLADDTLGALVRRLRLLGFDVEVLSFPQVSQKLLAEPERIFLSRSLKRTKIFKNKSLWIRYDGWVEQLQQVLEELSLALTAESLTRCSLCNLVLEEIKDKTQIQAQVPDFIYTTHDHYYRCPKCQRVYWQGSHWQKLEAFIEEVKKTENTRLKA